MELDDSAIDISSMEDPFAPLPQAALDEARLIDPTQAFPHWHALEVLGKSPDEWDWQFTPADLQAFPGDLQFHEPTVWMTNAVRRAVKAGIYGILTTPKATIEGVSAVDLYHCHLVVPRPCYQPGLNCPSAPEGNPRILPAPLEALANQLAAQRSRILKPLLNEQAQLEAENIAAYTLALPKIMPQARQLLQATEQHFNNAYLLFHSLEYNRGSDIAAGDPIRNWLVSLADARLQSYQPPQMENAGSYSWDFYHVMKLVFLVDIHGFIHCLPGESRRIELSTITGVIYPPLD